MTDQVDPDDVDSDGGALDTDDVAERRHTERHGDDVDEAARRSSGFDLVEDPDDDGADDDEAAGRR